jgi:hypothetical protein
MMCPKAQGMGFEVPLTTERKHVRDALIFFLVFAYFALKRGS